MKLRLGSVTPPFLSLALSLLLLLSPIASAQQKKEESAPPPAPKGAPARAPRPAPPKPPKPPEPAEHHEATGGASGAHSGRTTGSPRENLSHSTKTENGHAAAGTNRSSRGASGTNKATTGNSGTGHTTASTVPVDPRQPTGLNLRVPSGAGGAANSANATNSAGAMKLPNGGTKTLHADGSSVERNRSGKVTTVTTSKGATAKMDIHGRATAIRDGKGMAISRGPHGEQRIESTYADHSKLVSTGKQSGYLERHFNRGGHEFAQRSYYHNGHYYTRVYVPYFYGGYAYYGYIPTVYYEPVFYGWVYNPWPSPVSYVWGWYGAPWYAPFGYYFAPYPVYPGPAFWLADFTLAESLRVAAEEAESGSVREGAGLVYVSARLSQQNQGQGAPLVTSAVKDEIAEQVKQIIADEKEAAARQRNSGAGPVTTPAVPPSLDPRFSLFIVTSGLSLDIDTAACSITGGDILRRKDYTPDGNNAVAVEVVSSKNGDCAVGTASRLKVDDLEEMHDNFREKVDEGLKSLSENQGKGVIPTGPAANPKQVPEGQSDPDLTVGDDLKKQQEAADETEKDVQAASSDTGSAN
jgi:hypothetical protein